MTNLWKFNATVLRYILASRTGVLYVGMTNDLERRIQEHEQKLVQGFTAKYNVNCLVFYEAFPEAIQAIEAEKRIKGWRRTKKVALIESVNRKWRDLAEDFVPSSFRAVLREESP